MYEIEHLTMLLGGVSHFKFLNPKERQAIITRGQVRRHAAASVVFYEGEPCAGMYVLLQGQVQLRKLGPQGQEQIMAIIEPVIMFNEVPVLDGGSNVATAVASQDCVLWQISSERFQELLRHYPQMGIGLLRVLAMRNRVLIAQYEDLSFRPVISRTAKLLLDLSDDGKDVIDRHANPNLELAARIATVPEAFSRSLALFRKNGLVACTRSTITILQPDALAEMAFLNLV